jgi:hypothetical protein
VLRTAVIVGTLLLVAVGCSSRTEPTPETQLAAADETSATPLPTSPSVSSVAERPAAPVTAPDAALRAKVHEYTERFYRGEIDLLYDEFSPGLKEEFSLQQFSTLYEYVGEHFGNEIQIIGEDAATSDEYRGFVRWARFDKTEEIIEIRWTLRRDDDSIAEFWIKPATKNVRGAGSS